MNSNSLRWSALAMTALIVSSLSITNMASIYILGELGGSDNTASYTMSFFALGNVLALPLGLRLGGKFGLKNSVICLMLLFLLMSFAIGQASNYPIFLAMRFIHGFVSGPLLILLPALRIKLSSIEEKEQFIYSISLIYIVVTVVASSVGGTIAYMLNWRLIFLVDTVIGIPLVAYFFSHLRGLVCPIHDAPFDWVGYIVYVVGLFCLTFFIIMGQELDWFRSPLLSWVFVIGVVSIGCFFVHSYEHPFPVLRVSMLCRPQIVFALLQIAILFICYFGTVHLISLWLHNFVNYTPNWIAIVLGMMAISGIGISMFIHKIRGKNTLLTLGMGIFFIAVSCYLTMWFDAEVNFGRIVASRLIAGAGFALFLPPLLRLTLLACGPDEGLDGLAFFQMMRALSSGLGVAIFTTIWQRRDIFYYDRLGGGLTWFSQKTKAFFTELQDFSIGFPRSYQELDMALDQQAQSLALNDTFYLMLWIMVVLMIATGAFSIYLHVKPEKGYI